MIRRIKRYVQVARRRAQLLAAARKVLRELEGETWAEAAALSLGEQVNLLLHIGLMHLKAVQAGQAAGKAMIAQVEARRAANLN
jgi:hypothetical protein